MPLRSLLSHANKSHSAYSAAGGASIKASAPDEASELLPTISDEEKELFSKALAIIKVEKPVDTDIPNNPETLIQYVAEGCTQLKNSKFRALYRRVASIESAARTWSRVVDSAIKCVPEPGTLVCKYQTEIFVCSL